MSESLSPRTIRMRYAARVRTLYGPQAATVSLQYVGAGASLRVADEAGDVLSPPDEAAWADLMGLLDDTLAVGGAGVFVLSGTPAPAAARVVPERVPPAPRPWSSVGLPW